MSAAVTWHDLECGAYTADLELWHELAARHDGPVLEVGAGTGRVTLELARAGHEVWALDSDSELLATLAQRAQGLPVTTALADARAFSLQRRFALIVAPMQTIQLLEGGETQFFVCARAHLAPGGVVAVAIAEPRPFEDSSAPLPDMLERDGWLWSSRSVAVRRQAGGMAIERLRERVSPSGERDLSTHVVVLAPLSAAGLEQAARAAGLSVLARRAIAETDEHVGSEVVMLGG